MRRARLQIFKLAAFEPTDEELCTAANMEIDGEDDEDETLGGFIVRDDEEDDDDFGKAVSKKKPRQPNRAVIQDSDDEEHAEQSEAEEEPAPRKNKGKGKQKEKPVYELKFIKEVRVVRALSPSLLADARSFTARAEHEDDLGRGGGPAHARGGS